MSFTNLELFATVFSLACVWLTVVRNIWCWPTAIIGVTAYFFVFYQNKLYADMSLQVVFLVQSIYGWYFWLHGKKGDEQGVPIRRLKGQEWLLVGAIIGCMVVLFGYLSDSYTDTDVPYLDASVASVSLVANILLARKILDNWIMWIVVDMVYVGLFFYKELYLTTALYLVFFFMAITGYVQWQREWKAQNKLSPEPASGEG